jgi:hypothetical protein
MPDPRPNESRDDFMDRCMGDDKMVTEFGNPSQRAAVCNSYFEGEEVEGRHGGQHGKPGPNDPRKTPAKPSERRKGSKRNKPGSAKKPNTGIKISKETENTLRQMMEKHNKAGKGSKATMGALKSVYRRGAGAFSRTHAPNMSRGGWAIARVRAFLYLLKNGRPSNPNYKQDNDLLPKSHPRASVEAAEYRGRTVKLNKPFRTPKGPKKFAVYTKNESGTVVIVRFGDPKMEIKRDDPQRRKNFRSRHNCKSPGPKWKARYWSCKMWERGKSVTDYTSNIQESPEASDSNMGCGCGCSDTVEAKMEDYIFSDRERAIEKSREIGMDGEIHESRTADGTVLYFPGPDEETFQNWYRRNDPDAEEELSSEEVRKDYFTTRQEAIDRAEELGCSGFHMVEVGGERLYMPCGTHSQYEEAQDEADMEAYHHMEEEELEGYGSGGGGGSYDSCPPGYTKRMGRCERIAVTIDVADLSVDSVVAEASDGRKVVRISGIAFHQGINKNGWEITRAGADLAVSQMVGADLTLNHPKSENGRFRRNMDGGIDEAVVGVVTEATVEDVAPGKWNVRFKADVLRTELFEALESGLWLRKGYGVSIGGSGVPDEVFEAEDGKTIMRFESDFEFDHLAIVHRPAYEGATISHVEVANVAESFNSHPAHAQTQPEVKKMTDEMVIEASEVVEESTPTPDYESEIAALQATLAEREAEIEAIRAAEAEKAEAARAELVARATELGMAGVDDLASEVLESLIASWEAAHPVAEVEMKPVKASENVPAPVAPRSDEPVVANFLNRRLVETPAHIYERAYNVWAKAWNSSMSGNDLRAPTYGELKEKNIL